LDGEVRAVVVSIAFTSLMAIWFFGPAGCASGQPPDPRLGAVEVDTTLTHAVLILENPSSMPVEVLLRRPGMLRQFMVPAGPLLILWKDGRVQLTLRERTRNQLTLAPATDK
jgi:hypothetical protein